MPGFQTYLGDVSGLNVHLLDMYNKKVCDFTSGKPIVLKLSTHERPTVRGPLAEGIFLDYHLSDNNFKSIGFEIVNHRLICRGPPGDEH